MAVAQTLPNIQTYPLWQAINEQSNNVEYSLEVAQVQLTSAQLLALKTTAIQVTPTPAPNQSLWVDCVAAIRLDFNTTAYTLNAGNLEFFYGPPANAHPITVDLSAILTAAGSRISTNIPILVVAPDTFANIQGQPIFIGNTGTANYTLGNSTLTVTLMFGRTTP